MADEKLKLKKAKKETKPALKQLNVYAYKYFAVIIILVVAGVFYAFYIFVHKEKYNDITSNAKVLEASRRYDRHQEYLIEVQALEKVYKNISEEKIAKVDKIVDQEAPPADLYREIEYIGRINGLTASAIEIVQLDDSFQLISIDNSKSKKSTRLANLNQYKLVVNYEMDKSNDDPVIDYSMYDNLIKTLEVIENNLRLMDVTRIEYDPMNHTAKLEIRVYQGKDKKPTPAANKANVPK